MANLRKRGPSQWQAQVRVCGYPNQTKTFDTRAAVWGSFEAVSRSDEGV